MMWQGTFWAYKLRPPESERQRQANVHCSNIEIAKTWKQQKRPSSDEWTKERSVYTMQSPTQKRIETMPFEAP